MAITIPSVTELPNPPLKSDPSNFAARADAFLSALELFSSELNATIAGMNGVTSGLDQTEPIAAYNASTTYGFPDVCAGSDGYTYRCIGTSVTAVDPTTDDGTTWVRLALPPATVAEVLAGTAATKAVTPANAHLARSKIEAKTASFTAAAGYLYLVTPSASTTVVATLPTTNRGPISIRLLDASSSRVLAIDPTTDAIEDLTAGDRLVVDHENLSVSLDWDGTAWRVI